MIPAFVKKGPAKGKLPPGVHESTWADFCARYAVTPRRRDILTGLEQAVSDLKAAGCQRIYVDGSFVTDKPLPGDFDLCWEPSGVNMKKLNPVLTMQLPNWRSLQKQLYKGELFLATMQETSSGISFVEYFQRDTRLTRNLIKGIIAINL